MKTKPSLDYELAKKLLSISNGINFFLDYIDREIVACKDDSNKILNIDEIVANEARMQTLKEIRALACFVHSLSTNNKRGVR